MNQPTPTLLGWAPANFADGFNAMTSGPNPREISNFLWRRRTPERVGPHLMDDNGIALSGMMYAWGQSSITIWIWNRQGTTRISRSQSRLMTSFWRPQSIPMTRVAIDPATGVAGHPANLP